MGFAKGFAQGWEAESERIERRKLFQQELNEKRIGTLAEVVSRRKAMGLGTTEGGTPSVDISSEHYNNVLLSYGMEPKAIADLTARGGVYGLQAAAEVIAANPDAVWTPEHLNKLPQAIIVTQPKGGGPVDVNAVANELYGPDFLATISPEQKALLDLESMPVSAAPQVTSTFRPVEPVRTEVVNQTVQAANETLVAELTSRREEADERSRSLTGEDQAVAIQEAMTFDNLIKEVEKGNIMPGIQAVGGDIIGPYLENNPQLKSRPELLGPWKFAAEAYLRPPEPQVQSVKTGGGNSFNTKEEALAAIKNGQIPSGATFYVGSQAFVNDLE